MILMSELPAPSCPRKKQQNEWKINQVKKTLAARLGHPGINNIDTPNDSE